MTESAKEDYKPPTGVFEVTITREIKYRANVVAASSGDAAVVLGDRLRATPAVQEPIEGVEIRDQGLAHMNIRRMEADWRLLAQHPGSPAEAIMQAVVEAGEPRE